MEHYIDNEFLNRRSLLEEPAAGARAEARNFLEQSIDNEFLDQWSLLEEPAVGAQAEARNFGAVQ